MRSWAVLASLAVLAAAASLPPSFVTVVGETTAITSGDPSEDPQGPTQAADTRSEPERDDDLDEQLDDVDELVAMLDAETPVFVRGAAVLAWPAHETGSPRAPHREDTLRPPIVA